MCLDLVTYLHHHGHWRRFDLPFCYRVAGSCGFLAWWLYTPAKDALSLTLAVTRLRSRLCFRFRPASLPVFCCQVSSSSRYVLVLLHVFMVRRFGGSVLSPLLVCGYSLRMLIQNAMVILLLSLETSSLAVLLLFSLVVMRWW